MILLTLILSTVTFQFFVRIFQKGAITGERGSDALNFYNPARIFFHHYLFRVTPLTGNVNSCFLRDKSIIKRLNSTI